MLWIRCIWFWFGSPFLFSKLERRHRHSAPHTHTRRCTRTNTEKYEHPNMRAHTHTHEILNAEVQILYTLWQISPSRAKCLPLTSLYLLIPALWLPDPTMALSWWLLLELIGSHGQRALIELPWLYILCWSWTHYFNRPLADNYTLQPRNPGSTCLL